MRGQDYANAAQKYLESRNAFERAKRDADEARAVAARPSPSARPPALTATATGPRRALGGADRHAPAGARPPPPRPRRRPTATPLPSPSASLPPAPGAVGADAAVRRVIEEYGRAISSQDVALFRSLKPDLTADDEKRLREAFGAIKSQVGGHHRGIGPDRRGPRHGPRHPPGRRQRPTDEAGPPDVPAGPVRGHAGSSSRSGSSWPIPDRDLPYGPRSVL